MTRVRSSGATAVQNDEQGSELENAVGQWPYGVSLRDGRGIPMDPKEAAHYFKLSADQGNPDGQWLYGECLRDGRGIPMDLQGAAHYFKLSADQGNADGQWLYGESSFR
jgi:TPR repeat protein